MVMVTVPMDIADLHGRRRVRCGECGFEYQLATIEGVRTWDPKRILDDFGQRDDWRVDRHIRTLADVTGNRRADIVGFGDDGVWVALAKGDGTFESPRRVLEDFGAVTGRWRMDRHVRTLADLTGKGRSDIVGFGHAGVWTALAAGDGTFERPRLGLADFFGFAEGWRVDRHPRRLADVMGEGRADVVGFDDCGVWLAPSAGDGRFGTPRPIVEGFGGATGWRVDRHPRLLGDLTGDGRADIVGFGEDGVWIALNEGGGRFGPPRLALADFGAGTGWRSQRHPRLLADVTGDGRADLVGFGDDGVWVALNRGGGEFGRAQRVDDDYGTASGWRARPRLLADVTGEGRADLVGFGAAGVVVATAKGDGTFGPPRQIIDDFGTDAGWRPDRHPIVLADVTGDGRADIVGFGETGVHVAVTILRPRGLSVLVPLEEHSELPVLRRRTSVVGPWPLDTDCPGHHDHDRLRRRRA